ELELLVEKLLLRVHHVGLDERTLLLGQIDGLLVRHHQVRREEQLAERVLTRPGWRSAVPETRPRLRVDNYDAVRRVSSVRGNGGRTLQDLDLCDVVGVDAHRALRF